MQTFEVRGWYHVILSYYYPFVIWSWFHKLCVFSSSTTMFMDSLTCHERRNTTSEPIIEMPQGVKGTLLMCNSLNGVHPGNLTWNTITKVCKMIFLFNWVIFSFQPFVFWGEVVVSIRDFLANWVKGRLIKRQVFPPWVSCPCGLKHVVLYLGLLGMEVGYMIVPPTFVFCLVNRKSPLQHDHK